VLGRRAPERQHEVWPRRVVLRSQRERGVKVLRGRPKGVQADRSLAGLAEGVSCAPAQRIVVRTGPIASSSAAE
jgi:hypothetical protein